MELQEIQTRIYEARGQKIMLDFHLAEHGVTMLANVLRSKKARQTSVAIVRAFIALKQFTLTYREKD